MYKENVIELFLSTTKQTVPSNAFFHGFIAWGGVTRMVEQLISALPIHVKHVLSMM